MAANTRRVIVQGPTSFDVEFVGAKIMVTATRISRSPPPAVLSVCRESRQECIAMFELIFGIQKLMVFPSISATFDALGNQGTTYFNTSSDLVLLSERFGGIGSDVLCPIYAPGGLPAHMNSIAVDLDLCSGSRSTSQLIDLARFVYDRKDIQEIILIFMSERSLIRRPGELELVEWDVTMRQIVDLPGGQSVDLAETEANRVFTRFVAEFKRLRDDGIRRGCSTQDHIWPRVGLKRIMRAGKLL